MGCAEPNAIGYWILPIGCWLLAIAYWLLPIGYWLLAIGYWLSIGCWLLSIVYWLLSMCALQSLQRPRLASLGRAVTAPASLGPGGQRRPKHGRGPHRSRRQPTPLPGLRCGTRLVSRASPPRRPTPVVRSEGGGLTSFVFYFR
jgi:hypothetical protein